MSTPVRSCALPLASLLVSLVAGCASRGQTIDTRSALYAEAQIEASLKQVSFQWRDRDRDESDRGDPRDREFDGEEIDYSDSSKSVAVGELLAVFPGMFVHGLGHYYAGDKQTADKIRSTGEWGYLLMVLGGGVLTGAFFLDDASDDIFPLGMYITGGGIAAVGLAYFFTAWISDMWDTPRAVRSGGQPWSFYEDDDL